MKTIVQYQIEIAICLAAFTLLYLLIWRNERNFLFKRILLLAIPIFSLVIPLINIDLNWTSSNETESIQYITYLPSQIELVYAPIVEKSEKITNWEIAFWILITGSFLMLIRLLISYYKIMLIHQRSTLDQTGEFRTVDDKIESFSFFKLIMINHSQAQSKERDYILAHENAHRRQGHSWDILCLEAMKMLHWFNPLIWFITQESKRNLEYLADQEVATAMNDVEEYQFAIVRHAFNANNHPLKTQFSKTNLKKRIVMMSQPKNQNIPTLKFLATLPVIMLLLMSFSLDISAISRELPEPINELSRITMSSIVDRENSFDEINPLSQLNNSVGIEITESEFQTKLAEQVSPDDSTEKMNAFPIQTLNKDLYQQNTYNAAVLNLKLDRIKVKNPEMTVDNPVQLVMPFLSKGNSK